jgi:hypothetical protein
VGTTGWRVFDGGKWIELPKMTVHWCTDELLHELEAKDEKTKNEAEEKAKKEAEEKAKKEAEEKAKKEAEETAKKEVEEKHQVSV